MKGFVVEHAKKQSQEQSIQATKAARRQSKPQNKETTEDDKMKFLNAVRNGETAFILKTLATKDIDINTCVDSVCAMTLPLRALLMKHNHRSQLL